MWNIGLQWLLSEVATRVVLMWIPNEFLFIPLFIPLTRDGILCACILSLFHCVYTISLDMCIHEVLCLDTFPKWRNKDNQSLIYNFAGEKHNQCISLWIPQRESATTIFLYYCMVNVHIDGLVQARRNSIANALELRLSCTNPSVYAIVIHKQNSVFTCWRGGLASMGMVSVYNCTES